MDEKKQILTEEDLIAFLDGRMSSGGGAVKPKFEEGKMVAEEPKLFSNGLDEECPTCASIPNIMQIHPDNERWDEDEEDSDF